MEVALIIGWVLTVLGFIVLLDRRDDREQDERRELLNRKAEPSMVVPPKEVVKSRLKVVEKAQEQTQPPDEISEKEQHEFAAVGRIDPPLIRPDEK